MLTCRPNKFEHQGEIQTVQVIKIQFTIPNKAQNLYS